VVLNPLPWKHIWQLVWNKYVDVSTRDFLWRLVHRVLWVGYRFRGFAANRVHCVCCGNHDTIETVEHLFFGCVAADAVWTWMQTLVHRVCNIHLNISIAFVCLGFTSVCKSKTQAMFCNLVRAECLKAIWHYRNRCVFDEIPFSSTVLLGLVQDRVVRHLQIISKTKSCPNQLRNLSEQALLDPFMSTFTT